MRHLIALGLLAVCPLAGFGAAPPIKDPTLVRPVLSWSGLQPFYDGASGKGAQTVDLITNAQAFGQTWKFLMQGGKVPEVNFKDYFVVVVHRPLGLMFSLGGGLAVDARGAAKVSGFSVHPDNRAGQTHSSTIGIFPRGAIKTVEGKKLPAGE